MRVFGILDNQFYLSGVNAYWRSMAFALGRLGHQVHTLGLDDGTCPWNRRFFDTLTGYAHRIAIAPSCSTKAATLFRDAAPDLVMHHYSDFGLDLSRQIRASALEFNWKDIYICHSDDPDHYNRIEERKGDLAHVICVSKTCREHLVRELGFLPEDTSLGHYFFVPPPEASAAVSRKAVTSGSSGTIEILYAGRLETYQKRAGDLVPFAEALQKKDIPFRLHIAGSGSLDSELRESLAHLTAEGTVVFHGYLDEDRLFVLMEGGRIYVSFSEFEGLSTSMIQAMHFGLIPLITGTRSGTDFLAHGKQALIFRVGEIEGAANLVQSLGHDPSLGADLARRAAEKVKQEFGEDKSSYQLSLLLQRWEGEQT